DVDLASGRKLDRKIPVSCLDVPLEVYAYLSCLAGRRKLVQSLAVGRMKYADAYFFAGAQSCGYGNKLPAGRHAVKNVSSFAEEDKLTRIVAHGIRAIAVRADRWQRIAKRILGLEVAQRVGASRLERHQKGFVGIGIPPVNFYF